MGSASITTLSGSIDPSEVPENLLRINPQRDLYKVCNQTITSEKKVQGPATYFAGYLCFPGVARFPYL